MRRVGVWVLVLGLAGFSHAARAAGTLPFVGCQTVEPSTGQVWWAPKGTALVTSLPAAVAAHLAVYAGNQSAVLAPRGWSCTATVVYTLGSALIVTPTPLKAPPARNDAALAGPIVILWNDQRPRTVDRFGGAYFPDAVSPLKVYDNYCGKNCVQAPGPVDEAPFLAPRQTSDVVTREGDLLLGFETPAGRPGLGADAVGAGVLPKLPSYGLLALSDLPRGQGGVVELTVRLPAGKDYLRRAIIGAMKVCLPDHNTVACESGGALKVAGIPIDDGD